MLVEAWPGSVKMQDNSGRLPLHVALGLGLDYEGSIVEVIQLLVEFWLESLQVINEEGNLPLHVACCRTASSTVISYIFHSYPQAVLLNS